MQREVISICPVCESQLHVTRLHCNTCGTSIEGEFTVGRFANLERDQMLLLEAFLRSRGNLRELERELGVSYPTVRNRVETLLRALGLSDGSPLPSTPPSGPDTDSGAPVAPGVSASSRRHILERLARKEISAEEAAALLRGDPQEPTNSGAKVEKTKSTASAPADSDTDPDEDTTIVRLEDA